MKRNVFFIAALLVLSLGMAVGARAQEPVDVHVLAIFEPHVMDYLVAAEFRIDQIPRDHCIVSEQWASNLIIGDIDYGFAIAFLEPQPGPIVYLGTLSFLAFSDVGEDAVMWVYPSNDSGKLVVVDDQYLEIDAAGWVHIFNCNEYCGHCDGQLGEAGRTVGDRQQPIIGLFADMEGQDCDQDLPVIPTAAAGSNWGRLKALYR